MTKFKVCIITLFILGGALAGWLKYSLETKLAENRDSLRRQSEVLARLQEENERLLNAVANNKSQPLSPEQFRNLLKLRNEAGQHHWTKMEVDAIRATNQQILEALPTFGTNENYWLGDQLAFVGYAEPEAAMKTTIWASTSGDVNSFLASQTQEGRAQFEGMSETEIAAYAKAIAKLSFNLGEGGVRVVGKKMISEEEATLDLYYDEDEKVRRFALKKSGGEWKVGNLIQISD